MKGKKKHQKRGESTESRNSFQLDERKEVGEIKIREEERKKKREVRERWKDENKARMKER